MSFYNLGIEGDLVYSLELKNISKPTPIQSLSIPHILNGKDLVAEAQTGTGKTYAFLRQKKCFIKVANNRRRKCFIQGKGSQKALGKRFELRFDRV